MVEVHEAFKHSAAQSLLEDKAATRLLPMEFLREVVMAAIDIPSLAQRRIGFGDF